MYMYMYIYTSRAGRGRPPPLQARPRWPHLRCLPAAPGPGSMSHSSARRVDARPSPPEGTQLPPGMRGRIERIPPGPPGWPQLLDPEGGSGAAGAGPGRRRDAPEPVSMVALNRSRASRQRRLASRSSSWTQRRSPYASPSDPLADSLRKSAGEPYCQSSITLNDWRVIII